MRFSYFGWLSAFILKKKKKAKIETVCVVV